MSLKQRVSALVLVCTLLNSFSLPTYAESVDDKFTQIPPNHSPGSGEFVHGTGYGKLLVRVLMFGSIPQQGVHYMPEGTDLLFAILYAGGYGEATKLSAIQIRRRNQKDIINVDLEEMIEDGEKIPRILDGDIVNVPYNWRKDIATIGIFTGFISAMTGFTLSVIALTK